MNRSVVRRPGAFFSIRNHPFLIEKGENKHVILDGKHALEKPTNFMRTEMGRNWQSFKVAGLSYFPRPNLPGLVFKDPLGL